jgi:hypothetical protein
LRARLVLIASLLVLLLGAGTARAAVKIYQSDEAATFLGEIGKGKCKVKRTNAGRVFHGGGKTTNGAYTLDVDIYSFKGFGPDYLVPYGVIDPTVSVEGVGNALDYSNNYPFPGGQPPGGAGGIAFGKGGARLGLGIYALPNSDYSQGVVLAGHMKCLYPKR